MPHRQHTADGVVEGLRDGVIEETKKGPLGISLTATQMEPRTQIDERATDECVLRIAPFVSSAAASHMFVLNYISASAGTVLHCHATLYNNFLLEARG